MGKGSDLRQSLKLYREPKLLNFHKLLLDGVTCSKRDFTVLFSLSSSFVLSLLMASNITLTDDESLSSRVYAL